MKAFLIALQLLGGDRPPNRSSMESRVHLTLATQGGALESLALLFAVQRNVKGLVSVGQYIRG